MIRHLQLLLLLALALPACKRPLPPAQEAPPAARNIILLIGDGMGIGQLSTLYYLRDGGSQFSRFKSLGLHENRASSHRVTDSAAGATAFSCGVKTYNGAIGVDSAGKPLPTILETLAERGYKTGLVATSSIQHATPAAFYAHAGSRGSYTDIAAQLVHVPVDFFAAGGRAFFTGAPGQVNRFDSLQAAGYTLDTTALYPDTDHDPSQRYAYLLAADGMPKMQEGRGDFLPQATAASLDYFRATRSNFFLMVEGSQIDWGGHNNDAPYIYEEMKDFEKAVGVALDFAELDRNTLVIVTADHETGGFSLPATDKPTGGGDYGTITPDFTTGHHTAALIPVFAYGPGAELFQGIYGNQEIYHKMFQALRAKKP